MKQRFYTSGLFFLVMLITCILTGCSDDKNSNSTEDNGKKSHSTAVDMSSWPDDLPKFEYGKLFQILNDEDTGKFRAATLSNITNPETAYKDYKTALSNKGWVLDVDSSNENVWDAHYIKGTKAAHFTIQKDGSVAQLFYIDH